MKKLLLFSIAFIAFSVSPSSYVNAQGVGINPSGNNPDNSAMLDVSTTNKGMLIPRLTITERNSITSPAQSLMIFNTTTSCLEMYGGTVWQSLGCICTAAPATPGIISGSATVCANSTGNVYSISVVSGAAAYNWTVPASTTVTSNTGSSITVTFGSSPSGNITVSATNNCGTSGLSSLAISQAPANATGGTITNVGAYTIHTFTSSGTFILNCGGNVEVLVVAGGGGGGAGSANNGWYGGGGAGGLIYNSAFPVTAGTYAVTVGTGGAAGSNGNNSVFSSLTAIGGGVGGQMSGAGSPGGSGGGGGGDQPTPGGAGTPGQGNNGGYGYDPAPEGGGGGGAVGQSGGSYGAGAGGAGLAYSISGTSTYYAGGGAGGLGRPDFGGSMATGGIGGGGNGGRGPYPTGVNGTNGAANTGGGGGGGYVSGSGGSGIVIIRYTN